MCRLQFASNVAALVRRRAFSVAPLGDESMHLLMISSNTLLLSVAVLFSQPATMCSKRTKAREAGLCDVIACIDAPCQLVASS